MAGGGGVVIRRMGPGDGARVAAAGRLFDSPPDPTWTERFLAEPTHHLLIGYRDDDPAGFVSAVEMTHPDKGTEMFLYELGVAAEWRRQGVAKALLAELVVLAVERGCYGMWVLTDDDNEAALASYRSAGGEREGSNVMFEWTFGPPDR
jgi:ribosomal protein S18 acetylase RimI-like enzyme